jgi:ribosomal protein L7/L12
MNGKIFQETSNIFQDQAKILFNYYQQMAEKIVQEEERIEKEIAKLLEEKKMIENLLSSFWTRLKLWFQSKLKKTKLELESVISRIDEFQKLHKEIFRDYKVSKLGVAYVPIADQIKYENKSFIVDHTGMVDESEVKLQLSRQNDLLIETISALENLSAQAPLVESSVEIEEIDTAQYSTSMQQINQHDYFGKLERSLRTISYCMDDLDVTSVSLPLVANESSYLNFLKEFSTNEVPEGSPVFEVFNTKKYKEAIAKFQELNKLKDSLSRHSAQFEDVLRGLMVTMANSVQAISALKVASTDKIVFESNKVLYKILKSPYNHYSPVLEASEIERIKNENFNYAEVVSDYVPFQLKESSKVRYNLLSDTWTAEDGSTTNFPFGVHQIHEEIVAPIVQNLMNETRIERLKIYNHIKDQKISYLNKWHQDTEDFYGRNRAESADLINLMRASLRDYVAAYNTLTSLKKTEESMAQSDGSLDSTVVTATVNSEEVFAAFELQSKEFQNVQMDFESYMERLKEDIDVKAGKFEHIDYYDALLRDGNSKDIAVANSEMHELDERRKPLITVNPLFAKTSEMPAKPNIEDITYDHISLNLPSFAKNTLRELDEDLIVEKTVENEAQIEDALNNATTVKSNDEEISIDSTDVSNDNVDKISVLEDATNAAEINELEKGRVDTEENLDSEEEEDNVFSVFLVDSGNQKLQIVKLLKEIAGIGLKEAKDLVDSAPIIVLSNLSEDEAKKIKEVFESFGATVGIKSLN